ncbi:MAG TPA: TonB-dependent receptor [Opitutaceae bacterium]|nr:TonB-dependent receptor [Opitutaceae bacterium]
MNATSCSTRRFAFGCRRAIPVSFAVLSAVLLGAAPLLAQTTPATTAAVAAQPKSDDTVVLDQYTVTGVRASLISAQELKQNAPELVDSIVAEDIGKFPDNTVADALQHVAGIQVSRAAGEANTVVIRGLPNIETTVNGYEVFTGTSRGVALQDIPAELVAGVDVYKSIGPDKVEGGVAGLIDVRLHRPFDFPGLAVSATGRGIYATQAKKDSYNLSGLVSNRWKLANGGEFGALIDVSYARVQYEDQVVDNYVHFGANGEQFDLATDPSGVRGYYADNFGIQLSPGDRKRTGVSAMLQWKPNSETEFYWDNLYTRYDNQHITDFFIGIPSWANAGFYINNVTLYPAGYDGYNVPEKYDAAGTPARFVKSLTAHNTNTLTSKQSYHDKTDTYQGAFGGKWDNGTVKVSGEVSYNVSTFRPRSVILDTGTVTPSFSITYNDNNASSVTTSGIDYTNVNNFFLTQLFDQWQRSHSVQYAVRGDVLYRLSNSLIRSLQGGLRYAERDVNYHSANNGGIFKWDAAAANSIPGLGRISSSEPFIGSGQINVRHWWSADENFLLNNTDVLRPIFGQPLGLPPADPSKTFLDKEKTTAFYAMANYSTNLGDLPIDGLFGARFVNTDDSLGGFQRQTVGGSTTGGYVLTNVSRKRWETLPTATARIHLMPDLQLRGSITKTITRPDFGSLNPALSLTSPGPTLPGQGSGGNPDLSPIKSTNYDLSLEYYPSKTSMAAVTPFYRTLDGYIQSYGSSENIGGSFYTVTRPRSTHNGYLEGVEAQYQYFFDFLPDPFKGLGFQANYTYIKGETENPLTNEKQPIAQVSKDNYNLILIYEHGPFSSRLAYNWRGRFIDSFNQSGIQPTTVWVQPTKRLDFSASYAITKDVTVTFDATNILKSKYHDNFGNLPMFARDVRSYDSTYELGVRCRF